MIKLAIIGCGAVAQYHLRALQHDPFARVTAVADLRVEAAQTTAEAFAVPHWTTRPETLLADPAVDGVILALATHVRTELALEAFRRGKHVLLEKPVAMSAADAERMIAVQGDRVGACCSSRYRALASAQFATEFLRTGGLGPLRVLRSRVFTPPGPPPATPPPDWRLSRRLNGGGVFVNWGSYDLDYMLGLLDFKLVPQHVLARTWRVPPSCVAHVAPGSDGESHALALITFTNGAALAYERSEFAALPAEAVWQISGEAGTLSLQMRRSKNTRVELCRPAPDGMRTTVLWEGDETEVDDVGSPANDFAEAIATGRKPRTSLREALVLAKISDAVYASAESGAPVTVA